MIQDQTKSDAGFGIWNLMEPQAVLSRINYQHTMNRIQNVLHNFSLVQVNGANEIVGNDIGDGIQVQWVNAGNQGQASLFVPRIDMFMRTLPVLGVVPNEGPLFQFDLQVDGSYVIHAVGDNINRLVLNNAAGEVTNEPAPPVNAPDFNKQFWRLVARWPLFMIQNVLNDRSIAVIEDPLDSDNWIVVGNNEGHLIRVNSVNLGQATLDDFTSDEFITIDPVTQVVGAGDEQVAQVFQFDLQNDGSYVIHAVGDDINRLALDNATFRVTNEPAPPVNAPDFNKQFWRLVAPPPPPPQ
ncbi:hypothetical protein EDB19DRAFT_2023612 [Suillus lakei]|nr:hypothetical protein EDB19DRAFT_2023612 [Suillus lakei]